MDARDGKVAIHGWKTVTDKDAFEFCEFLRDAGADCVIYTDISRDGTLSEPICPHTKGSRVLTGSRS